MKTVAVFTKFTSEIVFKKIWYMFDIFCYSEKLYFVLEIVI